MSIETMKDDLNKLVEGWLDIARTYRIECDFDKSEIYERTALTLRSVIRHGELND